MPNSPHWSSASAPCHRLEWRPSRWLITLLPLIGLLAAGASLASALPLALAWPLAVLVAASGAWLAYCESRRPRCHVVIAGDGAAVEVDGMPVDEFAVAWRGWLAFASWRDVGVRRRQRLVWWPDTLPAPARRELRLAAPVETSPRPHRSMAN